MWVYKKYIVYFAKNILATKNNKPLI